MTIREALSEGTRLLRSGNIDTPELDVSLLLARLLGTERARLVLVREETLKDETVLEFNRLIRRRLDGESIAYINGTKEFWGLDFTVSPAVLVPRPDTEILVEAALGWIKKKGPEKPLHVIDLCTGSGVVAVSLKHECPHLDVAASDISPEALGIAGQNARRLLGEGSIQFYQSNLWDAVPGSYDLIVSNPPYIPAGLIKTLSKEVSREPLIALDGGADGLDLIRSLVAGGAKKLVPGGALFLEADPGQMAAIRRILEEAGFADITLYKDLAQWDRVIAAELPEDPQDREDGAGAASPLPI